MLIFKSLSISDDPFVSININEIPGKQFLKCLIDLHMRGTEYLDCLTNKLSQVSALHSLLLFEDPHDGCLHYYDIVFLVRVLHFLHFLSQVHQICVCCFVICVQLVALAIFAHHYLMFAETIQYYFHFFYLSLENSSELLVIHRTESSRQDYHYTRFHLREKRFDSIDAQNNCAKLREPFDLL